MVYRKWLTGGMLGLGLLVSMPAMGDQIRLIPTIAVSEDYNDNIFFSTADSERDFITRISPGLNLENNTERMKARFTARLDQLIYADNSDLNATNQFYEGNVRYALNERINIGALAKFIQDSSPDRDIETSGFVLNTDKRNRQRYGISGDYAFTEKTTAGLSYDYGRDKYSADIQNTEQDDQETNRGNLLLTHDLSTFLPEMLGRLNLGYANFRFTDSTVENYTAKLGLSRRFSELWSGLVDVGARYTPSRFEVGGTQTEESSEGWGGVANAVISYKGEKSNVDFSLNHDIMPDSGRDGASNRTSLIIRMNRRFAYEFSGFLAGGYILNLSDPGQYSSDEIDQQTLYIRPGIRYNITQDMAVDVSYTYTRTEYERDQNTMADRNLIMARFYLQYPILE